ncbi:MAG: type IV secretion pathway protein [Bradyrhizobiaceae bacterium]|nr:MAG: type IV secretion pathway protein [Bradyrhizobiaceae bacterium]
MWRRLFIICIIACPLGGCGTWTKGPPSCDGLARRPLNRSLWDWESGAPSTTAEPPASPSAPIIRKGEGDSSAPSTHLAASGRWAIIAASYRACGKEA